MIHFGKRIKNISPALLIGLMAIASAFLMFFFRIELAIIPLACFVILCAVSPFFPSIGFFFPVFSRGQTGEAFISLTFDDGPDPVTTPPLLELLKRHGVTAAFFVTGERVAQNGNLVVDILRNGHEIGNHSYHHDPFLMLRSSEKLYQEIASNQVLLKSFGICPVAFRPPVGITSPRLADVLDQQGLCCINFSCRPFDAGNRWVRGISQRILKKVAPDDIILLHDTNPRGKINADGWLYEIESLLLGLKEKELIVVPVSALLGKAIMIRDEAIDLALRQTV